MNGFNKAAVTASFLAALAISAGSAYDGSDLAGEQSLLMAFQNRVVRDAVCCYLNMKRASPVLSMQDLITYSVDLSYGSALAPLFFYDTGASKFPLFGPLENIYGNGEEIPAVNLSLAAALPADFLGTIDFSFLPDVDYKGAGMNNFKFGASLYYRLLKDAPFVTGLYTGAGYSVTSGSINRKMNPFAVIGGTNVSFTGDFNSDWNYNGINLEIFANNQLFILNFYGRLDYYCLFGRVRTVFSGVSSASADAGNAQTDNSINQGVVLSAGAEIALGWFKLNVEAGKDFLSQGMYVNAGLRFGY